MKKGSMILIVLLCCSFALAQRTPTRPATPKTTEPQTDNSRGKLTGMIFNDIMYIVQEPTIADPAVSTSGRFASSFRRATLGFDYQYAKGISARIVYDGSSNSMKQAFVNMTNLFSNIDLRIGLNQTLSSETVEKIWAYRSMDATVLDRKGMTQEFDMGFTLTGRSDAQGSMYGRFAMYNGTGTGAENNESKKFAFSAGYWLNKSSVAELYVDYEEIATSSTALTAKAFYGMGAASYAFGVEAFLRMNSVGTVDVTPAGASLYSWFEVMPSTRGIVRLDVVDDDLNVSATGYRELYVNVGLDYFAIPEVHLIPNVAYVKNLKKGTGPEIVDYISARLTTAVYFR